MFGIIQLIAMFFTDLTPLKQEDSELEDALRILGITKAPAVKAVKKFEAAIRKVMRTDSHTRNATKHLVSSPSLPDAHFDPVQYVR